MRIYLIGLPGVGKSTIGKVLAQRLNYAFIDLDNYIEQQATLFVDEIFQLYGENYFRALESNALKEVDSKDNIVVACGGGIVKNKKNKDYMHGICIYLSSSLTSIQKRLDTSLIERPILVSKTVEELYMERKEAYDYFKDIEIINDNISTTLEEIIKKVGKISCERF